jgi:threonine/homoserine/homoserine lactone efflux protein
MVRQLMSAEQLLAFAVFAFVTSATPGPNNVMLTATGANVGVRRGLPHMFGVAFGFGLMVFLVAAGVGSALIGNPEAMLVLRVVGVAILLWLAWKIATAGRTRDGRRERPIGFFQAAAFQWVNPKAWLICASAVGSFLQTESAGAVPQAALFVVIFVAVGMPCMFAWLGFGATMQRFLRSDRTLRIFNIAMGLLLAATVLLLV